MLDKFLFGDPKEPSDARFELLRTEEIGGRILMILRDTVTCVLYVTGTGDNCPLTPMIRSDGTPVVNRGKAD